MTCGVSIFRIRIVRCPFCDGRLRQEELRTHIGFCNEHNTLYMGRFSPTLTANEQLAVAVPLPPPFVLPPPTQAHPKYADI
jgi:hypothetical protein